MTLNILDLPNANLFQMPSASSEIEMASNDFKQLTNNYYSSLFNSDWNMLENQYANNIKEFSNHRDVSKSFAISDHRRYYNRFSVINYEFIPNSFREFRNGINVETNIIFKLTLARNSDGKRSGFKIKSKLTFDDDLKINSIKEELLETW